LPCAAVSRGADRRRTIKKAGAWTHSGFLQPVENVIVGARAFEQAKAPGRAYGDTLPRSGKYQSGSYTSKKYMTAPAPFLPRVSAFTPVA